MKYGFRNNFFRRVIIPDDILIRDGISCGDSIIIQAGIDNGNIHFNYDSNACISCQRIMGYIYRHYNKKPIGYVIAALSKDIKELSNSYNIFCKNNKLGDSLRKECMIKPLEIVYNFFQKLEHEKYNNYSNIDTSKNLDCDACVSTGRIAWNKNTVEKNEFTSDGEDDSTKFTLEFRKKWMPLSKIKLDENEKENLKKNIQNLTEEDAYKLFTLKIDQMIFYHLERNKFFYRPNIVWKSILYRQYRHRIVKKEIDKISQYIRQNKLEAYFVKGALLQDMYTSDVGIRVFQDYDILAFSGNIAFSIATFLFKNGFKIYYSEFSIKKINNGKNVEYTGHFHLQKVIYGLYNVIIDINFPGFPLGRVSLYVPMSTSDGHISDIDTFIITLCHLFKHRDVFMKDINDLYLILRKEPDIDNLIYNIRKYDLEYFFIIAVKYISNNYNLRTEYLDLLNKKINFNNKDIENWPYDYTTVYNFKRNDWNNRIIKYEDNKRIYLFPLAIFNKNLLLTLNVKENIRSECVDDIGNNMIFIKYYNIRLLLCGMGLFWDNDNDINKISRNELEDYVNKLLEDISMKDNVVYLPYYLERIDRWFI